MRLQWIVCHWRWFYWVVFRKRKRKREKKLSENSIFFNLTQNLHSVFNTLPSTPKTPHRLHYKMYSKIMHRDTHTQWMRLRYTVMKTQYRAWCILPNDSFYYVQFGWFVYHKKFRMFCENDYFSMNLCIYAQHQYYDWHSNGIIWAIQMNQSFRKYLFNVQKGYLENELKGEEVSKITNKQINRDKAT